MIQGCNCTNGLGNTGQPNCIPIQSVTSKLILVPLYASDGTRNGIDLTITLPIWSDLINQTDASKRWFPTSVFENVEMPKADSQFDESNSGRKIFLREGVRSFAGELWAEDSSPTILGKLKNNRCVDFGVYIVDVNGNLVGSQEGTILYPVPVDNPSFDPKWAPATDSSASKIMLGFDFARLFDDSTLYMITPTEAGIDFNSLSGLIDVNFEFTASSDTDATAELSFDFGTALNKLKLIGALAGDFTAYNNTTLLAVVILSATETPDGTYNFTFATQTVGDSLTITLNKEGFVGAGTRTL
jgi:hypothetical protein